MSGNKHKARNHDDTSPVKVFQRDLNALQQDLRKTTRAYASRLEKQLAASALALSAYEPAEKLSRERLHRVRDLAIMVRSRRLRPEKGRRKDLRKIEMIIDDLRTLVDGASG